MELISHITEAQFNFVNDVDDINSREAVLRLRICGKEAYIDFLQGRKFLKFLRNYQDEFIDECSQYGVHTLNADTSIKMTEVLERIFYPDKMRIVQKIPVFLHNSPMFQIKIELVRPYKKWLLSNNLKFKEYNRNTKI